MRTAAHRLMVPLSAAAAALILMGAMPALAGPHDNATSSSSSDAQSHSDRAAQDRVSDAASLVQQMKQDPALAGVLQQAKGIFIIPHYGRGGLIFGGQGGGGVVMVKHGSQWSSPAFYSLAGGSVGAQAGGEGGAIAMILLTQRAVDRFRNASASWSLIGSAGLTVVNWSDWGGRQGTHINHGSQSDVILWTNTRGLYGGLTAGVTHVSPDTAMDRAYYQRPVTSSAILAGRVNSANADPLRDALAARVATR